MNTVLHEPALEDEAALAAHAGPPVPVSGREYVVLQLAPQPENAWLEIGSFPATTSEQAIRDAAAVQAADPDIDMTGVLTYVAVPARSFQPVELTARVEPKIEFRSKS